MKSDQVDRTQERRRAGAGLWVPRPSGTKVSPGRTETQAATGLHKSGIKIVQFQDSQLGIPQPTRSSNPAVSSEGICFLLPRQLVEIMGLTPQLIQTLLDDLLEGSRPRFYQGCYGLNV